MQFASDGETSKQANAEVLYDWSCLEKRSGHGPISCRLEPFIGRIGKAYVARVCELSQEPWVDGRRDHSPTTIGELANQPVPRGENEFVGGDVVAHVRLALLRPQPPCKVAHVID